jgi:hypothetical protein
MRNFFPSPETAMQVGMDQSRSTMLFSTDLKYSKAAISTTTAQAQEMPSANDYRGPCSSNDHRKPSITPTAGFNA